MFNGVASSFIQSNTAYNHICKLLILTPCTIIIFSSTSSIDKVHKIQSAVMVIHGTDDEVIDFSHGLEIYDRSPITIEPLWVEGAGHNDVELFGGYLERLKRLIEVDLPKIQSKRKSSDS